MVGQEDAMSTMKLTQNLLPMLMVQGIYWDRDVRQLGYRVRLTGHRSWIVRYTSPSDKRERRMVLGPGDTLSLKQARNRAREVLAQVGRGVDPLAEREQAATAEHHTLRNVAALYLSKQDPEDFRSLDKRRRDLNRWIAAYGNRPMSDIRRLDVLTFLEELKEANGQGAADSAFVAFSALANWYAFRDEAYNNPIKRGLWKVSHKRRERTLSDDELRAMWACTDTPHPYHCLLRFLALTGVRLEEACEMSRTEVAGDVWTIPTARMKAKEAHVVPLSAQALEVLRQVPLVGLSPLVFTITGQGSIAGYTKFAEALRKRMAPFLGIADWKAHEWWTPHDLRRTFSTRMNEQALAPPHVVEACLAHSVSTGVAAHYNQATYFQLKRSALSAWANYLGTIINPTIARTYLKIV
jgi:integrase